MAGYKDGFEYLARLRELNPQRKQTFESIKHYLSAKTTRNGIPSYGILELTPLCNFSCKMCYVHLAKEQMQERPLLTVEQWKDIIHQAWEAGMIRATLTGGECLTYPGFKEIYLYIQSLGCEISVLTNGALMNDEWIRFFQENQPKSIQITLYGENEEVYERVTGQRAFSTVKNNINRAAEANLPFFLSVTPSR